jgi:hypothetical protein
MNDDLFDYDGPNYDGQGKSREEETDGSMMVVGCLVLMLVMAFLIVAGVLIVAMVL